MDPFKALAFPIFHYKPDIVLGIGGLVGSKADKRPALLELTCECTCALLFFSPVFSVLAFISSLLVYL